MPGVIEPLLASVAITATITSLVVESPFGQWLRENYAGAPTEEDLEVRRQTRLMAPDAPLLKATHPRLDEGLQCARCTSIYVASAVTLGAFGFSLAWPVMAATTWLLARLVLAAIRAVEYRADG